MLGKLLKYDLKWSYKVLVYFYAMALFFSVVGRGLLNIENSAIFMVVSSFCIGVGFGLSIGAVFNCIIRLWVRFRMNLYGDEAYLTHTLPVSKGKIFTSKILSAFITIFASTIVFGVCLFICYYSKENLEILKNGLELAASTYDTTVLNLLLLILGVLFLQIIFIVLVGNVGIILGHNANQNKIIKSIIIGFTLYMGTQIFSVLLVFGFALFNSNFMNLFNTTDMISTETIKALMYSAMVIYLVYIAGYFVFGKKQLEKGVNVE